MADWIPVGTRLPERGQRVRWMGQSGQVATGTYEGVWLLDDGMYVYYDPTYWQPLED